MESEVYSIYEVEWGKDGQEFENQFEPVICLDECLLSESDLAFHPIGNLIKCKYFLNKNVLSSQFKFCFNAWFTYIVLPGHPDTIALFNLSILTGVKHR